MADVIRVKAKKTYEWNQDNKFIYVRMPFNSNITMNKINIFVTDLILRATSSESKHCLDFLHQVDYKSKENKFILAEGILHAHLKKQDPNLQWSQLLVSDISLAELKARRKQSQMRAEAQIKQSQVKKDELKHEYERKATQELMRFQAEQRKILQEKKFKEKQNALDLIFSPQIIRPQVKAIVNQESIWNEKEKIAIKLLEEQQEEQNKRMKLKKQQKPMVREIKQNKNAIFTQMDEQIYEEIPIREATCKKVQFTARKYPGLAARDSFEKEPPMPQGKANKQLGGDLQNKNPLWLKDKGDKFYQNKNYVSAVEAYSESIRADPKNTSAYMNRTLAFMKIFKFNQALLDCESCQAILRSQIANNNQSNNIQVKIQLRKAICFAWKGMFEKSKSILQLLAQQYNAQKSSILLQIQKRQQSLILKMKGDHAVKLNKIEQASRLYAQSIAIDQNEYAISNRVFCLLKLKQFKEAEETAELGIKKITSLIRTSDIAHVILLKLYYRKAKALQELNRVEEAEQCVKKGLLWDAKDIDLLSLQRHLKVIQNNKKIQNLKTVAANLIKENKHGQALQMYNKCLKMLQSAESLQQYLNILQNQAVCYLKLQQYDHIISVSIRILQIVKNIQSKIVSFQKNNNNLTKNQLQKISIRTLMRRANAYVKTNQFYNAKIDLEKALQINPQDESVMKQLQKLKTMLKI